MNFFHNTIKAAGAENSSLSLFLLKNLRDNGVLLNFCDIWCNTGGIYVLLNSSALIKVLIHQTVLTDKEFQAKGAPYFHCTPCETIQDILYSEQKKNYAASITPQNAFTFKIAGRRAALSVHHNAPLNICPDCLSIIQKSKTEIQRDFENLSSSLYAPSENIGEEEYESLINFFKSTFNNRCSYCHESTETLFLVQNDEAEFSLICSQHQNF